MALMLITYTEKNRKTGAQETRVSHGVDMSTDRNVVLEDDTLDAYKRMGARYDTNAGEWFLPTQKAA